MHIPVDSVDADQCAICDVLSRDDCLVLLALQRLSGLGTTSLLKLISVAPKPGQCLQTDLDPAILAALAPAARKALLNFRRAPRASRVWEMACRSADWLEARGAKLLPINTSLFPPRLAELSDAPSFLFSLGDPNTFNFKRLITIVGTRKPTALGQDFAYRLAAELAEAGFGVVSGMAEGIDSSAHWGALTGQASTVSVWATGLDRIYPAMAKPLAEQIASKGLILTEMPPGTKTNKGLFVRRNRIVAALSEATIVVEAERKSGSLITAELALDLNREVAAVPGAVNSSKSEGCHHLIKQGAALIESSEDVLALLGGMRTLDIDPGQDERNMLQLAPEQRIVLEALKSEPLPAEILQLRVGLDIETLNQVLIDLELQGVLLSIGGTYQRSSR